MANGNNDPLAKRAKEFDDATTIKQLPDGKYQAKFIGFMMGQTKSGKSIGNTWVSLKFQVMSGKFKGKQESAFHDIDRQSDVQGKLVRIGLSRLKGDLDTMGVLKIATPLSTPNLKKAVDQAKGTLVSIQVKTSKDGNFRNIYVNDVISTAPTASENDLEVTEPPGDKASAGGNSEEFQIENIDMTEIIEEFSDK